MHVEAAPRQALADLAFRQGRPILDVRAVDQMDRVAVAAEDAARKAMSAKVTELGEATRVREIPAESLTTADLPRGA